ncbi:uncharacterized protein [Bombus fervidus]|uniref:uncharacterized protein n=1 Tax=Bombus fervidus TaxID=203811 RepID=UPI003AB129ED
MFDDTATGTIIRASATGDEITSRSVGSCTSVTNDVDQIPAFAADSRRFCPLGGCIMKYAIVTDATVSFWRREDTLKLKRNETLQAVGALLIEDFGKYYNLTVDSSTEINIPWPDAFEKLMNRDIDMIAGPKPEDLQILDNVEVICWYMFRDMVLASLVHIRTIENDILKLVMPFHYFVWISVFFVFIVYTLLLIMLRKLSSMGLIKEQVKFAHIWAISLSQSITLPRNLGLRLVLLLWMIFSLYLSITYNSTFTSSLAQVDTEDLLQNLEQVRDSGQPLSGPGVVHSYFNNSDDQFIIDLYKRYEVLGPEEALDSIFKKNGFAVLQHFTVDRMNWDYRNNRSLRMYTLPKPVFRFPVFFFARRGYMYRRPLRRLITKYRETGMIKKLSSRLMIEEDQQIVFNQDSDEILTMKHLRPIFEIFFVCQGIGCLIFLIELLVARILRDSL